MDLGGVQRLWRGVFKLLCCKSDLRDFPQRVFEPPFCSYGPPQVCLPIAFRLVDEDKALTQYTYVVNTMVQDGGEKNVYQIMKLPKQTLTIIQYNTVQTPKEIPISIHHPRNT
jgi:hypothetical protein